MADFDLSDDELRILKSLHLPKDAQWTDKTVLSIAKKSKLTTSEVARLLPRLESSGFVKQVHDAKVGEVWVLQVRGGDALDAAL